MLAEADVPYEELLEMDVINSEFKNTDVVIILGANDVVNPSPARTRAAPSPACRFSNAHEARSVFVVKRSLSPGYAGIKNELFEYDNTMMIFGDAQESPSRPHRRGQRLVAPWTARSVAFADA